jgi:tRNA:m4X modification enzyme
MGKKVKVVDVSRGMTLEVLRASHTACMFFMSRKRRFCNLQKVSGAEYCGVHRFEVDEKESDTSTTTNPTAISRKQREAEASGMKLERIPCPIDPTHSIYAHELKKHSKICNTLTANNLIEQQPYYCLNCNSGAILCEEVDTTSNGSKGTESSPLDPDVLLEKITKSYAQYVEPLLNMEVEEDVAAGSDNSDTLPGLQSFVVNELTEKTHQTSFNKVRHATQDAKIIKQMLLNGLFEYRPQFTRQEVTTADSEMEKTGNKSIKTFFVELGAGSGLLGYASHICTSPSHLIMVERGGLNNKIDKRLRREGSSSFHRVRMDIRNTKVCNLPEIIDQTDLINVIVIAKHLCGVASDLAINSLKDPDLREKTIEKYHRHGGKEVKNVAGLGLAVATCCHHACVYDDYAGKNWLTSVCGISREEFDLLKLWTSWATAFASTWTGVDGRKAKQVASSWSEDTEAKARNEETDTGNVPSRLFNNISTIGSQQQQEQDDGKDKEDEHIKKSRRVSASDDEYTDADKEDHSLPATMWKTIRPSLNLTDADMARIGFMCKRLLDHGRVVGLQEIGHTSAKQVRFCNPIDSPECYMLVA